MGEAIRGETRSATIPNLPSIGPVLSMVLTFFLPKVWTADMVLDGNNNLLRYCLGSCRPLVAEHWQPTESKIAQSSAGVTQWLLPNDFSCGSSLIADWGRATPYLR